jgi:putative ABC transport system substrate-binding protein
MNNRRKLIVALGASALLAPFASNAQQAKIYRVAILSMLSAANSPNDRAFVQEMEKLGWIGGKNIVFDYGYAEGNVDRLPALGAELLQRKPDMFATFSGSSAQAAQRLPGATPIVFASVVDPVGMGLVASLARPGGNVTGISSISADLDAKRVQLLKEAIPKASRMVVVTTDEPADAVQLAEVQRAAKILGIALLPIRVRNSADLTQAQASVRKWRADSMYALGSSVNSFNRELLAKFALENKLPMIGVNLVYAQDGALMSYGANFEDLSRRAATLADKILKGAKPADLPVEQPTRFYFAVNMRTAKALGIKIPNVVMLRADTVIE